MSPPPTGLEVLCDWGIPDTYTDRIKNWLGRHSYEVEVCVMGDAGQV